MIPEENRSLYDGFYTSIIAAIIAVAPLLGNFLKNLIEQNIKPFWVFEVPQFQLIFLITNIFMGILLIVNFKSVSKSLKDLRAERKGNSIKP
jgi:Na+/glutamate symporter